MAAAGRPARAAELNADLDGDGVGERVRWTEGALTIHATDGRLLGEVKATVGAGAGEATLAVVKAGAMTVLHAVALAGKQRRRELVVRLAGGALEVIHDGTTGSNTDGEWATRLRVDAAGVMRYQTAPGVARCDGDDVLFPELYDAGTRRFRAVSIAAPLDGATPLTAAAAPPRSPRAAPLGLFRFVGASSQRGDGGRADALRPPRQLEDGRADTVWVEGMKGWGRGAYVTARARAPGQVVTGLRLVRGPRSGLEEIVLLVGVTARYRIELPDAPADAPLWIALPGPLAADCITLVIADAEAAAPAETSLAEVGIYTRYDDDPGLLARAVADGAHGSDGLAQVLAGAGARGVSAIAPLWSSATREQRTRLLRVLLAGGTPESATLLVSALVDGDDGERATIAADLGAPAGADRPLAKAAAAPLLALAKDRAVSSSARAVAIRIIGGWRRPALDRSVVQLALAGQLGDEPVVARAVTQLALDAPEDLLPVVAADLAAAPRASSARLLATLAGKARGTAPTTASLATAAEAVSSAWRATSDHDLRFLLLRAAQRLGHPSLAPLLDEAIAGEDEVLRWVAVEAAAALDGKTGVPLLERATADLDPRVRSAALTGLAAQRTTSFPSLAATAMTSDRWPSVRERAATLLGAGCPGESAAALERAALLGPVEVRRAALVSVGRCDRARAAPLALRLVARAGAPLPLRESAALLVGELRPPGAAATLGAALVALLDDPRADERAAHLAASLVRALAPLGDPAAETALLRALTEPLSPPLRAAAALALSGRCTPIARAALRKAARDEDEAVRRAATNPRCR